MTRALGSLSSGESEDLTSAASRGTVASKDTAFFPDSALRWLVIATKPTPHRDLTMRKRDAARLTNRD